MDVELERLRFVVRRTALANLVLVLRGEAATTGGRLTADGIDDGVLLRFRDVVTLVSDGPGFAIAPRHFAVLLVVPPLWPFDREAAITPIVLDPSDFRHPNSDSRVFCLDTRGIAPERLLELVHDNLRLRNRNLAHPVDGGAAAFVRAHLPDRPTDPRGLRGAR